jgi:hypothetical protein
MTDKPMPPPVAAWEPIERLTRVGDFLLDKARECPEYMEGDKIIVLVVSAEDNGGIAARGYETHDDTIRSMVRFLSAVIRDG